MNYHKKIVSLDQLRDTVKRLQGEGKTVVQCHGCFDILHPGHLRHLAWAKQQGDILIVSVSADEVVKKGSLRPYVPQDLRAENLAALELVDFVTIDDHEWAGPVLELLQPNIYVKGKEFESVYTGRIGRERQLVESYGGQMRFSSGDVVYSSTRIIEDLKERLEPGIEPVHAFFKRHSITESGILQTVDRMRGKRVLVVGDTIVDRYVYCDRIGMSADAPVLVVKPLESDTFLGGAGIVARHINALGGSAHFCTVIGKDTEAEYVRAELGRRTVSADVVVDSARPTTTKTRYLSEGKKLLNVNQFRDFDLDIAIAADLKEKVEAAGATTDAIIICDFGYGVITKSLLEVLSAIGKKRDIPVVGDVQCSSQLGNVTRLKGITVATPSEREARLALCDRDSGIVDLGAMIMTQTGNRSLVITLAERGLMIFDTEGGPLGEECKSLPVHEIKKRLRAEYLPSFASATLDPMGAGDAMLATIACCLAAGASIMEAAFLGNCAASVECRKMGNIPVAREELLAVAHSHFRQDSARA
jgi:rfaE bifunctional protein kinase chain/domain/rfaE bifunctional protein nucleotidyltransferase chain/domain